MSIRSHQSELGSALTTTLITGATDGIGLALANRYDLEGHRLILVGRRPQALLGEGPFNESTYCQSDLADAHAPVAIASFLRHQRVDRLDRLILNAGTGYYGATKSQSSESIRQTVAVNLRASIALVHHCWPFLKEARGRVILIGSVIAALPCPDYAVYGATKAAVDGLARNLRYELAPDVSVQVIHPGATRTGFHAKIGVDRGRVDWDRFPSADSVAKRIARSIERGTPRSIPSFGDRLVWSVGHWLPRLTDVMTKRR